MIQIKNARPVSLNERVPFQCRKCGGCCRSVKDSVMLEPMDAYRLARYLRDQGEPVTGTDDVLVQYAHAAWLEDILPVFLLDTVGAQDTCVFLKDGRCSVYEARPRTCRLYPLSVGPGSRGRDFQYYLCTERDHHLSDGILFVKEWLAENFSKEAKTVLKADYDAMPILGQRIRAMGTEAFKRLTFQFLYYRYYNFTLDEPFLPQFLHNLEQLKRLLEVTVK